MLLQLNEGRRKRSGSWMLQTAAAMMGSSKEMRTREKGSGREARRCPSKKQGAMAERANWMLRQLHLAAETSRAASVLLSEEEANLRAQETRTQQQKTESITRGCREKASGGISRTASERKHREWASREPATEWKSGREPWRSSWRGREQYSRKKRGSRENENAATMMTLAAA